MAVVSAAHLCRHWPACSTAARAPISSSVATQSPGHHEDKLGCLQQLGYRPGLPGVGESFDHARPACASGNSTPLRTSFRRRLAGWLKSGHSAPPPSGAFDASHEPRRPPLPANPRPHQRARPCAARDRPADHRSPRPRLRRAWHRAADQSAQNLPDLRACRGWSIRHPAPAPGKRRSRIPCRLAIRC